MKKILFVLTFSLIGIQTFSQISETTSDFGMWEINYMLDEFGEPTPEGYITQKININGEFSSSTTRLSNLRVEFIIRKRNVSLQLYEHGKNHPLEYNHNYRIQIKHNGKIVTLGRTKVDHFKARNILDHKLRFNNSGDRLEVRESKELINLFYKGGEFKFNIIGITDYANRNYSFQIDDAAGFSNAYRELIKQ